MAEKQTKPRVRWRKQPSETGLARVCQSPRGYDLFKGDELIIRARPLKSSGWWFWYGLGMNTASRPVATMGEAKAQAMEFFRAKEK